MRTQLQHRDQQGGGCPLPAMGWLQTAMRQSPPPRAADRLVQSPAGRILFHLLCLCHDHHFQWHWSGIRREFSQG